MLFVAVVREYNFAEFVLPHSGFGLLSTSPLELY